MDKGWEQVAVTLMTERYPRLLARARLLTISGDEAADLVQESLVRTFSRRRGFGSLAEAEQYVRRTIVTVFADQVGREVRERARWGRVARSAPDSLPDLAADSAAAIDVGTALASLPPRVRACVALRYLDDLSVRETADQLGLSDGAVKRYVSDGLKLLNAVLGTRESFEEPEGTRVLPIEGGTR